MSKNPLMVTPVSSATNEDMVKNLMTNMDTIPVWFERCKKTNEPAWILSGGASLRKFLEDKADELRDRKEGKIFCIKHALPLLKEFDLSPDYCVVLDPRDINNVSTLGQKRKDLYDCAPKSTVFFVASMTHPSVTQHLIKEGYKVIGWHAETGEMRLLPKEYYQRLPLDFLIRGGTSSATRTIELSFFLGFTRVTMVGFDSCYLNPVPTNIRDKCIKGKGKQRYMKIEYDGKSYYTTGELIAQSQDLERFFRNPKLQSDVTVYDSGLGTLAEAIAKKELPPLDKTYEDLLRSV